MGESSLVLMLASSKAGASIDDRNKPFSWMEQKTWLNLKALSKHKFANEHSFFFKELPDRVNRNE